MCWPWSDPKLVKYKNVVSLGPGFNWSTFNLLITEIKTREYHVNLHLLLIFFDKYGPTLERPWGQSSFSWFSQNFRVKCRKCVMVDKIRTTYGHGLMDLRTNWQYTDCLTKYGQIIHGSLDKPRTYNSRTWQTTDHVLFLDLTKHGPLFKLRTPHMIYEKLGVTSKSE